MSAPALAAQGQAAGLDTVRSTAQTHTNLSPSLQGFEERRLNHTYGSFITDSVLRRNEGSTLPHLLSSRTPGGQIVNGRVLVSARKPCKGLAFSKSSCATPNCYATIYLDGALYYDISMLADPSTTVSPASGSAAWALPGGPPDLTRINLTDLAAIEYYATNTEAPPRFHTQSDDCGILLLYTREK